MDSNPKSIKITVILFFAALFNTYRYIWFSANIKRFLASFVDWIRILTYIPAERYPGNFHDLLLKQAIITFTLFSNPYLTVKSHENDISQYKKYDFQKVKVFM